eukprot:gnl/Spiro4/26834_TR13339_c0_g2_i1.p1 gnl/Spiro4/26834_TR13339_c0_g2~~gnl/Spiro4/26834_TR13339_c0_g2_i1.p1  ORF type:complete len:221 (+),score=16.29 gnl/Spiro4/26834_TR13339_c0_g2_i1:60-665(+)
MEVSDLVVETMVAPREASQRASDLTAEAMVAPREASQSAPVSDFSMAHPLKRTWTMYFDCAGLRVSAANWGGTIKKIAEISTVEDFWCLHNNLAVPTKLPLGSNYHFFRHDIKPEWEDPANQRGGKWTFHFTESQRPMIDDLWLNTDRISFWTRSSADEKLCMAIGHQIRANVDLPPGMILCYESHDDCKSANKAKYLYRC